MNIAIIQSLSRQMGRKGLQFKKNSPHIFFAAGLAGSVTSTILACRATLRLSMTLDEIQFDIDTVKKNPVVGEDDKRALIHAYARGAAKLARLYGPSAGVAVVSYSLLSGSHIQLTRRNAALAAAYAAVAKAYEEYRQRVIEELGEEKELEIYRGPACLEDAEDGVPTSGYSPYARIFDESNPNFIKNSEYNEAFLRCQLNYANDRLQARGHLFLNEVYDWLGFDHTEAGAVVGWVLGGEGDDYVDFGLFKDGELRDLSEPRIWLDFNVDGIVYNKI